MVKGLEIGGEKWRIPEENLLPEIIFPSLGCGRFLGLFM